MTFVSSTPFLKAPFGSSTPSTKCSGARAYSASPINSRFEKTIVLSNRMLSGQMIYVPRLLQAEFQADKSGQIR